MQKQKLQIHFFMFHWPIVPQSPRAGQVAHRFQFTHGSLFAVTHAAFHASMLRPASQAGPMHESARYGMVY